MRPINLCLLVIARNEAICFLHLNRLQTIERIASSPKSRGRLFLLAMTLCVCSFLIVVAPPSALRGHSLHRPVILLGLHIFYSFFSRKDAKKNQPKDAKKNLHHETNKPLSTRHCEERSNLLSAFKQVAINRADCFVVPPRNDVMCLSFPHCNNRHAVYYSSLQ